MVAARQVRLVCLSDTHGLHRQADVPDGKFLLHAGDFMRSGLEPVEIEDFDDWLAELPHPHKLVIAGNHDLLFEREPKEARRRLRHAVYLRTPRPMLPGFGSGAHPSPP